jgi:hypothetical protein
LEKTVTVKSAASRLRAALAAVLSRPMRRSFARPSVARQLARRRLAGGRAKVPSIATLEKLAKALGVQVGRLE